MFGLDVSYLMPKYLIVALILLVQSVLAVRGWVGYLQSCLLMDHCYLSKLMVLKAVAYLNSSII